MGWNPAGLEVELFEYPAPSLRPALSENPLENRPRSGPRGGDEGSSPRIDEAKRQAFWRVFEFTEEVSFEKRPPGGISGETRAKTLARAEKTGGGGVFSTGWNPARPEMELFEYLAPSLRPALSENPLENRPRSGPRGGDEGSSPRIDEAKRQAFWRVFEFAEEVSFEKRPPGGIRARQPGETRAKTLARGRKDRRGGGPFDGSTGNRALRVSGPVTSPRP